jgi:hypothetical protein
MLELIFSFIFLLFIAIYLTISSAFAYVNIMEFIEDFEIQIEKSLSSDEEKFILKVVLRCAKMFLSPLYFLKIKI